MVIDLTFRIAWY